MYTVYAVGGKNDGLELGNFNDPDDAISYAMDRFDEFNEEDLICTGTAVVDDQDNVINW